MPSANSCFVVAMVGLVAGVGGCAQTASFQVTRAPQAYTDGLHRIAVLDFAGPKQHGSAAAAKLRESLAESGRFQVVDEVELQHYAREPLRDTSGGIKRHAVMDAGRQMRLDGLLLGTVDLYDTRDEFKMRRGAPQAGATLEYELIELPRGVVRDSNKYRHVGPIALETSRPETALTICTNRAALNLVPHKLDVEVPLARSVWPTGALHAGNSHAAKGQWREAQEEWQQVLAKAPENHTALHNMGVAAEAQGRYAEARQFYRQALDAHQESMYEDALTRVENTLENSRVAEAQWPRRAMPVSPASFAPR